MSRAAPSFVAELLASLPPGDALPRDPASNVGLFLIPPAAEFAALAAARARMVAQFSPAQATDLLPDFERVLGPDPCKRDLLTMSLADRQAYDDLRWNAAGDPTPANLVAQAAALGVTCTVETFDAGVCGAGECGDEIGPETEAYTWIVHMAATELLNGECGASECGDPINDYETPNIQCQLAQWVPAHRFALFVADL